MCVGDEELEKLGDDEQGVVGCAEQQDVATEMLCVDARISICVVWQVWRVVRVLAIHRRLLR